MNILFWYRGDIDYEDWSKVLPEENVNKIIYFDTQSKNRSSNFKNNKFIKYLHKPFASRKYFKSYNAVQYFICPRLKRGYRNGKC